MSNHTGLFADIRAEMERYERTLLDKRSIAKHRVGPRETNYGAGGGAQIPKAVTANLDRKSVNVPGGVLYRGDDIGDCLAHGENRRSDELYENSEGSAMNSSFSRSFKLWIVGFALGGVALVKIGVGF